MASKDTFLLVSLEESKAKRLAQVISNDTSRGILDYLAEHAGSSETEIANALHLPLPTLHYNLQHLVDARLVQAKEFHYSPKGKEVLHYSLANRFIIIAPKEAVSGIRDKLKSLLPALVIVGAAGVAYQYLSRLSLTSPSATVMEAAPVAEEMATRSLAAPVVASAPALPPMSIPEPNYAFWLVIGAAMVIIIYLLIDAIRARLKRG